MSLAQSCPACGTPLPDDAPAGALCAVCASSHATPGTRTEPDFPRAAEASAERPITTSRTPQVIGEFEVLGKLGQGGMGAVYRARQTTLDRLVALKILPNQFDDDPDYVARFQREARVAASLNHPNLVRVYASGEAGGCHYIAMELVEGENLHQRLKRGALEPIDALRICLGVARGLQCGWERAQLIHRDIKPSNIYLSHEGEVKLGDLGLAKSLLGNSTGLTQTGAMMGTPHYISPEQARGDKTIDYRADIYSLGCTLYECLTGRTPYEATDVLSVMNMHVNAPPPAILKVLPHCPVPLARLVSRMLKKIARERPATYEELIAELERVLAFLESGGVDHAAAARVAAWKSLADGTAPAAPKSAPAPRPTTAAPAGQSRVPLYAGLGVAALALIVTLIVTMGGKKKAPSARAPAVAARANPTPAATPTATPAPKLSLSTAPWVDRMKDVHAANVPGSRAEGGGRYFGQAARIPLTPPLKDGAVRMLFSYRGGDEVMANCSLIARAVPGNNFSGYLFRVSSSRQRGHLNVSAAEPKKAPVLLVSLAPPDKKPLPPDAPIELELRAVGDRIMAKLNGELLANKEDTTFAEGPFGIAVEAGMTLHAIETLDLSTPAPAATPAPAVAAKAPASTASDGWTDGLAEWLADPQNVASGVLVQEGDAWRFKGPSAVTLGTKLTPPKVLADVAVRVAVRFDTEKRAATIKLRGGRQAGNAYEVTLHATGVTEIRLARDSETTQLAKTRAPAGYDQAASHTLEFSAQGDLLTAKLDGETVGAVRDATHASGGFTIQGGSPLFEKIEYRALSSAPAAAPAPRLSASAEPWLDRMGESTLATNRALVREGAAWRFDKLATLQPGLPVGDGAIRVLFTLGTDGTDPWLAVRASEKRGSDAYRLNLGMKHAMLFLEREGKLTALDRGYRYPQPDLLTARRPVEIELRAVGPRLTAKIDGQPAFALDDATLSEGLRRLQFGAGTLLHGFQTLDLGQPAPAPAADTLPWRDFLAEARQAGKIPSFLADDGREARVQRSGNGPIAFAQEATQGQPVRDVAVRIKWTPNMVNTTARAINVRTRNDATMHAFYSLSVNASDLGLGRVNLKGAYVRLLAVPHPPGFDPAKEHELELRAVGDELSVRRNGQFIGAVRDAFLTEAPEANFGAGEGTVVHKVEYAVLDGVKVPPALVPPAGDGPWTELLAPYLAKGSLPAWAKQAGAALQVADYKSVFLNSQRYEHVAIRVTARCESGPARWRIALRDTASMEKYAVEIHGTGRSRILTLTDSKEMERAAFDLPAGFAIGQSHTLEFRAQGDRLSVAVDGKELAAVHDATHTTGTFHLTGTPGTVFEKVELRELPAPAR